MFLVCWSTSFDSLGKRDVAIVEGRSELVEDKKTNKLAISDMPSSATAAPPKVEPRLSPEYVNIVSQTLPGLPTLGPDVAMLLAQDAEYYLRHLIHLSKKRMRHSKRTSLSVDDIYLSDNRRDRQPSLGHFSSTTPSFQPVYSLPGLYVLHDTTVSLFDTLQTPLPPRSAPLALQRSGIISPYFSFSAHISPSHATHPLIIAVDTYLSSPRLISALVVQRILTDLCSSNIIVPFYPILAILRYTVNANATLRGDTAVLHASLRVTTALAARSTVGIELFEDALISIVLTCLIGRNLGCHGHDVFELRQQAAETLKICLTHVADDFVRQRVRNTLSNSLTDCNASLGVIFGAITGLAVMGKATFESIVVPLIPKLMSTLDHISKLANSIDDQSIADNTLSQIVILSGAIERSMYMCGLMHLWVQPEFAFFV